MKPKKHVGGGNKQAKCGKIFAKREPLKAKRRGAFEVDNFASQEGGGVKFPEGGGGIWFGPRYGRPGARIVKRNRDRKNMNYF
jgi:hypothetical protein